MASRPYLESQTYSATLGGTVYNVAVGFASETDFSGVYNVKAYGAIGDGVTDDTTAIQAAIDAAKNSTLFFPSGIYKITSTLTVGTDGVTPGKSWYCHLKGSGRGTIIYCANDGMLGLWFKRTMPGTNHADAWPGYNNRLSDLTMVGPDAVDGSGDYIGINAQPSDTVTLLKSGFHTLDGDPLSLDCDLAVDNVNLWAAKIGWKMYLTHYGHHQNIGFEWLDNCIVGVGNIAARMTQVNCRYIYGTAISMKSCDAFYLGNPTMQVQNETTPIIEIYGAARGVVISTPYFEGASGDLIDVWTDNGSAIPSVRVIGGEVAGAGAGEDFLCRGGILHVDGFQDPAGTTKLVATAYQGADPQASIGPDTNIILESITGGFASMAGHGTPESNVIAPIGSTYHRTDGGAGTTLYVKESGTGNTGWSALDSRSGEIVNAASATASAGVRYVHVTYSDTGACAISLEETNFIDWQTITVMDADGNANTNNITIDTVGAGLINGSATFVMNADYEATTMYYYGGNFFIV